MADLNRRMLLKGTLSAVLTSLSPGFARADTTTGITATEIKIGSTTSLSGPVSALGIQDRVQEAFFKMVNEKGGIAGRQIKYIYYDDGFQPPKTVEQVRRLIESDDVAFLFNMLGTAPNSAVVTYINQKKVPHLFLSVNGDNGVITKNIPGQWALRHRLERSHRSIPNTRCSKTRKHASRSFIKMTISVRITSLACATCSA